VELTNSNRVVVIATLNEDDDIEEQQEALADIRSFAEPLETRFELKPDDQNYSARFNTRRFYYQSQIHTSHLSLFVDT
jgi:cell division protein ZapA (FtsZ GTPase activity inhibitor)